MMHYGYGNGSQGRLWILMVVAMVVFWAALAWIIVNLIRRRDESPSSAISSPSPAAAPLGTDGLRILNQRLANGDIDEDDYTRRRSLIEGAG